MSISKTIVIAGAVIAGLWFLFSFKRIWPKLLAVFIVFLILFGYWGFVSSVKGKGIDFGTKEGWKVAGQSYLIWAEGIFGEIKTLSGSVIKSNKKNSDEKNSTG